MLTCVHVACTRLWMNNWQLVQSFCVILTEPPSFGTGITENSEKRSFLSKYWFTIFINKTICFTLTLYVANIGIDVTIIVGVAQQQNQKVFPSVRIIILTELCNSLLSFKMPIHDFSWTLTIICSILNLFASCQHIDMNIISLAIVNNGSHIWLSVTCQPTVGQQATDTFAGWDENKKIRLPFGQAVTWGY